MLKTVAAVLLVGLFGVLSVHAEGEEKEKEQPSVVGKWLLVSMEVDGEEEEDDDLDKLIIVFTEDGKTAAYDNAEDYEAEEPEERGWYELDGEGNISVFEDRNANGELDEEERDTDEVFGWSIEDGKLVVTLMVGPEDEPVTMRAVFEPFEAEAEE